MSTGAIRVRCTVAATAAWLVGAAVVGTGGASASLADPAPPTTIRMSVSSSEAQVQAASFGGVVSGNGRYVAFVSDASKLVASDTNNHRDVFVRDRIDKVTRRVSVANNGAQANDSSTEPAISANGRYVAFTSQASNLVPRDSNGVTDVFIRDRLANSTRLVSLTTDGALANSSSVTPAISPDGRYVAFESAASNLVPGDNNQRADVFVRDLVAKQTTLVSVSSNETQGDDASTTPAISADGQRVAFESYATTLVPDDTNGVPDVFVRDLAASTTQRVSVSSDGTQADGESTDAAISADGRFVAFQSYASNLVAGDTNDACDVFVRDLGYKETTRVSVGQQGQANNESFAPALSADGRYVAFQSLASNLVARDTNHAYDVFVRDRIAAETHRVSLARDGSQANASSFQPTISGTGRYVAFASQASNLVARDTNGMRDVFLRDRGTL